MNTFVAELLGTAILILLGNGVVANTNLKKTIGANSDWIVVTFGWGMAVFVAVFCVGPISGAHINPAVTIGLALVGDFPWSNVPAYILAQLLGAMLGATIVWLFYRQHFELTEEPDAQKACFCTAPAIRHPFYNMISEVVGTFVLVFGVLHIAAPEVGLGALDALPVGLLVFAIGLSLGGTTGYAINPARDLGPRIMHQLLPMANKRDSDWAYSWVPVIGPVVGASLAALLHVWM